MMGSGWSRQVLDANSSHVELENSTHLTKLWDEVADHYNDPQNVAILHHDGIPVVPMQPVNESVSLNFAIKVQSVNPNKFPRRTGEQLKIEYGKIKTMVSVVWARFKLSGQHEGGANDAIGREDWAVNFCQNNVLVMYSILVLGGGLMDRLGKTLAPGSSSESGVRDHTGTRIMSTNAEAMKKRRQRAHKRQRADSTDSSFATGVTGSLTGTHAGPSMSAADITAQAMMKAAEKADSLEALRLLATLGDTTDKDRALHAILYTYARVLS